MKNYTITEEQIKTIEADGINYIKEWFPEVFKPKFIIGGWYKVDNMLFNITKIKENGSVLGYGIDDGEWFNEQDEYSSYCACNNTALLYSKSATKEEVTEALIEESKKRGFKIGAIINSENLQGNGKYSKRNKIKNNKGYYMDWDDLRIKGGCENDCALVIFKDGVWAEVIKEEVILNYDQIAEKFGIDVEQLRITKL